MAVAHVQDAAIGSLSNGDSQQTSAFGSNPTVGNYLVAWAWGWGSTTGNGHPSAVVFTDTTLGGNTWVQPTGVFKDQAADLWCTIAYAKVDNGGVGAFKVTANPNDTGSGTSIMVCAAEFSGVAASAPEDGSATGTTGTSVTVAPGNLTLTAGSLVAYVGTDDNTSFGGSTPTGFTRVGFQNNGSTFQVGEGAYAINPSSPANPSRTITSAKWGAVQIALLAVASAARTPYDPYPGLPQPLMAMRHRQPGHELPARKWWRATESGRLVAPDMNIARAA